MGKKILLEDYLNHLSKGNRIKLPLRSMAKILVLAKKHLNREGMVTFRKVIKNQQPVTPLLGISEVSQFIEGTESN